MIRQRLGDGAHGGAGIEETGGGRLQLPQREAGHLPFGGARLELPFAKRRKALVEIHQGSAPRARDGLVARQRDQIATGRGLRDTEPTAEFLQGNVLRLLQQLGDPPSARLDDMEGNLHRIDVMTNLPYYIYD